MINRLFGAQFGQAFFQRWWRQQSEAMKIKVKDLVNSGQLEFMYFPFNFSINFHSFLFFPFVFFLAAIEVLVNDEVHSL